MNGKILTLVRKSNMLRICNADNGAFYEDYIGIYNVTHLKGEGGGWYNIFNEKKKLGFVSNVQEVKEEW